jgi:peptidoglycan/xylan/chitin deacetylase (PgdA/CDA1 family)
MNATTIRAPLRAIVVFIFLVLGSGIGAASAHAEGTNLIQNPSFEIAGTNGSPANWIPEYWGSPVPMFKYPDVGRSGTDKGATVTFSKNSTGDARWSPTTVAVTAGDSYTYSVWYKSNVATEIDAEYTNASGKLSYAFIASIPTSGNVWKQKIVAIKIPIGITKAKVYQLISKLGTLTIDDVSLTKVGDTPPQPPVPTLTFAASPLTISYGAASTLSWTSTNATTCTASDGWSGNKTLSGSLAVSPSATTTYSLTCTGAGGSIFKQATINVNPTPPPPPPPTGSWSEGMVTLSFDDSWISQYTSALPILQTAGLKGTFYITTEPITEGWDDFMTPAQVKDIAQKGHEIGDHTVTHAHLTQLSQTNLTKELVDSKVYLEGLVGTPVTAFAYPYGEFNATVKNAVKAAGYATARGVEEESLNASTTDKYNLFSSCILKSTPFTTIKKAIDDAKANKQWYILCIHEIKTGGDEYSITPTQFQQIVDYLKISGVKTVTVKEGTALMPPG